MLTLFFFFANAIHFSYSQSADADTTDLHTNIHQLRSISVFLSNLGRTPLEQIVLAGRWRSANVFTDFYLKSLAFFSENLHGLAPLVAFNTNVQLRLAEANLGVRVLYRPF